MESPNQKAKTTMDDFTQLRLLGKGSYGEVYLVEKKDTKVIYALKTMDKMHMARVLYAYIRKRNSTMYLSRKKSFHPSRVLGS